MKIMKQSARRITDCLVNLAPHAILASLRRNHYELVAREFNRPNLFDWSQVQFPDMVEEFDDLVALFGLSPMNRGIIRQDFDEAAALFQAVRAHPAAHGVEIGRFSGGSTLLLAVAVNRGGHLISIDTSPQDDRALQNALRRAQVEDRVELIVGDANNVAPGGSFDFVFIDGDHSYDGARRDHNKWGQLVKPGGLIIHHDMACGRRFATQWPDLARLRTDILNRQRADVELQQESGSLAVFRRRTGSWTEI